MRVLIAEDDRASRRLLEATLRKWGYEVVVATDGCEAMKALQKSDRPSLAILDWMMPGVDGLEVARQVRRIKTERYVYMILLTARSRKCDMLEGLEAGADDYLTKPLDSHELRVRLRAAERIINLQTELIAARESLREQATHDALTSLWNRAAILDILAKETLRAQREDTSVGAIMADLDKFKKVNDTYGHKAGDIILQEASNRLQETMRPYDMVGRYGGEEFLIVVPRCDSTFAEYVAERLRSCIADANFPIDGHELRMTMSLGVASVRGIDEPCCDALIQAADLALYQAKEEGRNRVVTGTLPLPQPIET
jgi:diguanylate cyclase (GGDEF)-like protein